MTKQPAFPIAWHEVNENGVNFPYVVLGMSLRDYHMAHCNISIYHAFQIWAGNKCEMCEVLEDNKKRAEFMKFYAQLRLEYAEASIAASSANPEPE